MSVTSLVTKKSEKRASWSRKVFREEKEREKEEERKEASPVSEILVEHPNLGQNAHLKAIHVEQQVWIVLRVHRDKALLPLDGRQRARQLVLDLPEDSAAQINVMLHEPHATVSRPALLIVVADDGGKVATNP